MSCSGGLKSGNPCDKLMALCSAARADIIVKIVVPTEGNFDLIILGYSGIALNN